jgi:haloalkane dehalogenase
MISGMNVFVEKILPQATVRKLSKVEMDYYRAPYKTIGSRKPIRQWPLEIPIDGQPADVHEVVSDYCEKLQQSKIPKLLFYAHPGGLITEQTVVWCKENLPNLTSVDIGPGLHYVQEDNPAEIGEELAKWYQKLE